MLLRQLIMQKILFIILAVPLVLSSCNAQTQATHFEPIAVVELFTSEGCSSCPPADKLLSKLALTAEKSHQKIFPLSFHVDYWDRLGWKDPYSNSLYSYRQRQYAEALSLNSVYTPQIIVNGTTEFVGSDESKLDDAVEKVLRTNATATFTALQTTFAEGNKIKVRYTIQGNIKGCDLHVALISKQESTAVKRGENTGRQLNHTNVVRQFVTTNADTIGEVAIDMPTENNNTIIIAYMQNKANGQIIAAAQTTP